LSVGVAGCKICLELVGNCGFASHDTKSDALGKYGVPEEVELIRIPGTGVKAYTSPIAPLSKVSVGVYRTRRERSRVGRAGKRALEGPVKSKKDPDNSGKRFPKIRALEGPVKSKKDPDNSGDRFPEDVMYRSPREHPRWVALEQRARTSTEDRSCTMSVIRRDWDEISWPFIA
jgi:hypothetical protein